MFKKKLLALVLACTTVFSMVDQIVTTYKVAGKPVNTWVSGIMSGIKRNEFSEYRIPDRKQSYL